MVSVGNLDEVLNKKTPEELRLFLGSLKKSELDSLAEQSTVVKKYVQSEGAEKEYYGFLRRGDLKAAEELKRTVGIEGYGDEKKLRKIYRRQLRHSPFYAMYLALRYDMDRDMTRKAALKAVKVFDLDRGYEDFVSVLKLGVLDEDESMRFAERGYRLYLTTADVNGPDLYYDHLWDSKRKIRCLNRLLKAREIARTFYSGDERASREGAVLEVANRRYETFLRSGWGWYNPALSLAVAETLEMGEDKVRRAELALFDWYMDKEMITNALSFGTEHNIEKDEIDAAANKLFDRLLKERPMEAARLADKYNLDEGRQTLAKALIEASRRN